jgi:hypothetical protein
MLPLTLLSQTLTKLLNYKKSFLLLNFFKQTRFDIKQDREHKPKLYSSKEFKVSTNE